MTPALLVDVDVDDKWLTTTRQTVANLSPSERATLAQNLSTSITEPICEGDRRYGQVEKLIENAIDDTTRAQAGETLQQKCLGCPHMRTCRIWAVVDNYTGAAGGELFNRGKPISLAVLRRNLTAANPSRIPQAA